MTDTNTPTAIPWYRSTVLRGVLTIIVTQTLNHAQALYHFDTQVLGLGVNAIVEWIMDLISAGALAYMTHGRITQKSAPTITGTQSTADQINADKAGASHASPPISPVSDTRPTV